MCIRDRLQCLQRWKHTNILSHWESPNDYPDLLLHSKQKSITPEIESIIKLTRILYTSNRVTRWTRKFYFCRKDYCCTEIWLYTQQTRTNNNKKLTVAGDLVAIFATRRLIQLSITAFITTLLLWNTWVTKCNGCVSFLANFSIIFLHNITSILNEHFQIQINSSTVNKHKFRIQPITTELLLVWVSITVNVYVDIHAKWFKTLRLQVQWWIFVKLLCIWWRNY